MVLEFNKERVLKKYFLEHIEKTSIEGVAEKKANNKFGVEMEFNGRNISFFQLNPVRHKEGELEQILEITENIFDDVKFQLDQTGKIEKITNMADIIEKWTNLKILHFSDKKKQYVKDFIFNLSKIITNETLLTELIKSNLIFPFIFLGIYNKDCTRRTSIEREIILHNVFPDNNIPIRIVVEGETDEDGDKIFDFVGKHTYDFDRFQYIREIEKKYPQIKGGTGDIFDFELEGRCIYNSDNVLSYFEIDTKITVGEKVKYTESYTLEER